MSGEAFDEEAPRPPAADRVAARAIALSAVACRALIEPDAGKPGAEELRLNVMEWLSRLGVITEMEDSERGILAVPLGKLDRKIALDAGWCSEGMVVLAWVLGRVPLPVYYVECDPSDVANDLGFLDDRENTVLRLPRLRDADEITALEDTYLTLHWRLREFSTDPKPMDFSAYVAGCTWGPLRLDHVEICEGDLAIQGTRIDRVDHATFRNTLSIVQERHRAFNWLIGWEPVYSRVTTDT